MKNKYYTKRDPINNYFPLPNEVFALGLSPGALAVYSYLMYIEDRTTYQCHASYRTFRLNLLSGFFEMRLKNPFTYIGTKNRKNSHPKRKIFQKNFESRQKAALREWIFGYSLRPKRKTDNLPAATSSTGRA